MKTSASNSTSLSNGWALLTGAPRKAAALLIAAFVLSCTTDDPGTTASLCVVPTVISTTPASGEASVSLSKVGAVSVLSRTAAVKIITATFSTRMDPNTITTASFKVRQGADSVAGSVSYSDSTAYFIVPDDLGPNLPYTCTITAAVTDRIGTHLASDYVWSFTTIAPGTPTLVSPANGAVNRNPAQTMIWDPVPNADSYRLQVALSPAFVALVYDDSTRTSTSQPISGLAYGTTYYWRVNSKTNGVNSAYSSVWSFTTLAAPAAPLLISPLDSAFNVSTNPTLSWNASTTAVTYRLQISTSATFTALAFNDSTLTGTSQGITGLTAGTLYFWRVNAKNAAGTSVYSASRRFTTIAAGTPTLVSPVDGAINQSASPTMVWNAVPNAATYRLQISMSPAFVTTVYNDSTRTGTSQPVTGLAFGTTYYWRVNSKIAGASSAYSNVWSFTTLAAPAAPTLVAPAAAAQNQPTSLTLSWLATTGAVTYRVQVSTSATFATTFFNDSTITGTSQPITGLALATTYYWRVNAKNVAGTSLYAARSFTTIVAAPLPPVLIAPDDAAINVSTSPALSWNPSVGAATYRLQVSTSASFATTLFSDSTLTGTSQNITGLNVGTTYFWRVNAKNAAGTSANAARTFTTIAAAPLSPVLVSPADLAIGVSTSPILNWLASTGAATYRVQVSTSPAFITTLFNDSTITGTSQLITGLASGTTYFWRVNAKNAGETSAYSSRSFTTAAAPPLAPILIAPADAAVNVATSPTLSWSPSIAAATYRVQVSTSATFATLVFNDSTLIGTSQPLSGLTNSTTYFWRVNAKNAAGTSVYSTIWRFTVSAASPPLVNLGVAARFGSFGGNAGVTNQGILTQVNGSIGTTAASTLITGFHDRTPATFTETPLNQGNVRDTIYTATAPLGSVAGAIATQGRADAQTAFNYLKGLPPGSDPGAGELGGLTLAPGTYTSAGGTFKITSVDLTLDAKGDPNANFVFQMPSSLTVGNATGARSVILINGAQAKNVFWVVGTGTSGAATINGAGGGTMVGTIIAYSGVTFSTSGQVTLTRLEGRALGLNASVTMVNTIINVPLP